MGEEGEGDPDSTTPGEGLGQSVMTIEELIPRALELGGVVMIAVLLVWRIDVRMANVEKAMNRLTTAINKLLWKLER